VPKIVKIGSGVLKKKALRGSGSRFGATMHMILLNTSDMALVLTLRLFVACKQCAGMCAMMVELVFIHKRLSQVHVEKILRTEGTTAQVIYGPVIDKTMYDLSRWHILSCGLSINARSASRHCSTSRKGECVRPSPAAGRRSILSSATVHISLSFRGHHRPVINSLMIHFMSHTCCFKAGIPRDRHRHRHRH